jgi:hypothetical protein
MAERGGFGTLRAQQHLQVTGSLLLQAPTLPSFPGLLARYCPTDNYGGGFFLRKASGSMASISSSDREK